MLKKLRRMSSTMNEGKSLEDQLMANKKKVEEDEKQEKGKKYFLDSDDPTLDPNYDQQDPLPNVFGAPQKSATGFVSPDFQDAVMYKLDKMIDLQMRNQHVLHELVGKFNILESRFDNLEHIAMNMIDKAADRERNEEAESEKTAEPDEEKAYIAFLSCHDAPETIVSVIRQLETNGIIGEIEIQSITNSSGIRGLKSTIYLLLDNQTRKGTIDKGLFSTLEKMLMEWD